FAARSVFPGFRRLGLCFCCLCLRLLGARLEALELRRQDVLLGAATLLVVSEARAGRDEASDDDVLLEPAQVVLHAAHRGLRQYPRGLLERSRRDERLGRERRL